MDHLMHQFEQGKRFDEFNNGELHGVIWLVEEKMEEIQKRIEFFHGLPHGDPMTQTIGCKHKPLIQPRVVARTYTWWQIRHGGAFIWIFKRNYHRYGAATARF
ncbi:hypothetical protein J1N35_024147 [Gossypium stocksii]|uniref:Uncharacterized protein n=1 Tax=Gossypium stocksii TaxID=47602 RepID=A0A9D3VK50_9ROSI|nr:hypothetical protein J1N35_024147 [Gossypium stocksii]